MNGNVETKSSGGKIELHFGRRKNDQAFKVDFSMRRGLAIVDVSRADGFFLENVPTNSRGVRMGVCLAHADWRQVYIVTLHTDEMGGVHVPWDDNQYFDLAQRLMAIRGIENP